jgi:hypothetical protein
VLKSRVAPPTEYIIRGVDATEIIPQHASTRNVTRSWSLQCVLAAVNPTTTIAATGILAT